MGPETHELSLSKLVNPEFLSIGKNRQETGGAWAFHQPQISN